MANPFSVDVPNPLQALMAFEQSYDDGRKRASEKEMKAARAEAGQAFASGGDPRSALAKLLSVGDVQGARAIAELGNNQRDFQFRQQEAQRAQGNSDRSFGLQQQAFTNKQEPDDVRKLRAAGIDPNSPEGRKALFPRTDTPISATDKKAVMEAEDTVPQVQGTIENLTRALELNPKTFSGYTAGLRGDIGTKVPGGGMFVDKASALATSEWQKIMGPEALQAMASTLKGATTDFELRKFMEMLGDPATDPKVRESVIKRMKTLAERKLEIQNKRVKELRTGDYYKAPGAASSATAAASDPLSQAREAIAKGAPREAVMQRLQQNGIDPAGL